MKLLVVVLCLLSERYLMHSLSSRRFVWFGEYSQKMAELMQRLTGNPAVFANPWIALLSLLLPIIIITALIYSVFHGLLFGLVGFVLQLLIFFYCLGPDNPFYPVMSEEDTASDAVGTYFVLVTRQLFAPLFWYVVAGPIAVLTYRVVTLCQERESATLAATQVRDVLEWLPARLTVLLFLLVGNFQRAYGLLRHYVLAKPALNAEMLSACGLEALHTKDSDRVSLVAAEILVEHATMVFLLCIALISLGALI